MFVAKIKNSFCDINPPCNKYYLLLSNRVFNNTERKKGAQAPFYFIVIKILLAVVIN